MANVDNPHGFMPVQNSYGGGGGPKPVYLPLNASNTIIAIGDPLTHASGTVDRAAASAALCGIAAEPKAANSGGEIAVWVDVDQLFEAQTDDGTGVLTALAGLLLNANFVATSSANAAGGSTAEIDEDSGAATATLPFKVMSLFKGPSNAYGEFNRLVVKINNHQFAGGTGTVGT